MKYTLFTLIIILILAASFAPGAQAGKPRPTAYPPPAVFEAEAYPAPDSSFPFPGDPPPDAPYVWGLYYTDAWRWFVSKYTPAPDESSSIWLCTAQSDPDEQVCYHHYIYSNSLMYIGYQDGMTWYQSIPVTSCGWWGAYPTGSTWDGQSFVLHQPNQYYVPCAVWDNPVYLPFIRKP